MAQPNPFDKIKTSVTLGENTYNYYDLAKLGDARYDALPISIKVLLESAVRNCDNFAIKEGAIETILDWKKTSAAGAEIPFKPSRVLLQDFTGVPAVVDLAAMRDAVKRLGGDPLQVNPAVPADLVIDHSVQVDSFGAPGSLKINQDKEMARNRERFEFLKWGSKAFTDFQIVPPGSGIVHQVNLEYLARVVFNKDGLLYPDSVVGTDSHTVMINGLGVVGWGVGGIEAESVLCGSNISIVLPQVVGYRLTGKLRPEVTATDLVLTIVERLRQLGVVGKFVEFFGPGARELSLTDRATIANMGPEYGATIGFFPIDERSIEYLRQTNRSEERIAFVEHYLKSQGMFASADKKDATYSTVIELDLSTVTPCVSGPKRPHDRIDVANLKEAFNKSLGHKVGFHGFGLTEAQQKASVEVEVAEGVKQTVTHGDLAIAAITSCTNTSNPSVMVGAGLLAKRAVEKGLTVKPTIKTSLGPGSHVVTRYLDSSGLTAALDKLGFQTVGYGCTSCIGNSGDLVPAMEKAVVEGDLVASAVLSGNRNFEGRVHAQVRAAYLASPALVVAYALAGTVRIDFETEPIGQDQDGKGVFLRDIWPTAKEIDEIVNTNVTAEMFKHVYSTVVNGTDAWNALNAGEGSLYQWKDESTYIHNPPFFQKVEAELEPVKNITDAYALLNMGDSITTDHISPAGRIARNSPAARYLRDRGVEPKDFNTYGARRGNDEVMARGTFANIRLLNKLVEGPGPRTKHVPSGDEMAIFDAAERYQKDGNQLIILAGAQYGSGSSRDWAAKGPYLQGVKAVIAVSYERIHRSNLVGMGIVPLQFLPGQDADSLGLSGTEQFSIDLTSAPLKVGQDVTVTTKCGKSFTAKLRLDTEPEIDYYKNGGILCHVIRRLAKQQEQ